VECLGNATSCPPSGILDVCSRLSPSFHHCFTVAFSTDCGSMVQEVSQRNVSLIPMETFAMSFLADSVMKFLVYRAMGMFTYYHVSFFSLSGCHGTPISHVIYHNPLQTVIVFIAVRHEKLWALQPCVLSGTVLLSCLWIVDAHFANQRSVWVNFHMPAVCNKLLCVQCCYLLCWLLVFHSLILHNSSCFHILLKRYNIYEFHLL